MTVAQNTELKNAEEQALFDAIAGQQQQQTLVTEKTAEKNDAQQQLDGIAAEVLAIENNIAEIEARVGTKTTRNAEKEAENATLEFNIGNIEQEIADMQAYISGSEAAIQEQQGLYDAAQLEIGQIDLVVQDTAM